MNGVNLHLKNPLLPRWMQSSHPAIKQLQLLLQLQLHTTHVGAVVGEPQSSSTTTCAGKVDHELTVNKRKGHTYTNPRPSHYLTHAQSHNLSCRGESFKCQFHTTHVGAVGWEPHGSSPTTCAGKADHWFGVCVPFALICLLKIVN